MKKLLVTLFAGFIAMSFFSSPPKYEKISNQIIAQSSKELSEKFNLTFIGDGASMMRDVEMLALSFNSNQPRNLENTRKLIVCCMKIFLENINTNQNIRPFLHNYPFTEKNIELRIFFQDEKENRPPPSLIANVTAQNGKIYYSIDKDNHYVDKHSESFDDAETILKNNTQ